MLEEPRYVCMYATVMQLHHCVLQQGATQTALVKRICHCCWTSSIDTSANYFFVNNMLKFVICGNAYSAIEFLFPAFVPCLLACLLPSFLPAHMGLVV